MSDMATFTTYDTPLVGLDAITLAGPETIYATRIVGSVISDQDGTLSVQQSFDGTHWDVQSNFTVTGGVTGEGFSVEVLAPNVQLVYTNGAADQTVFRLYARTFSTGR